MIGCLLPLSSFLSSCSFHLAIVGFLDIAAIKRPSPRQLNGFEIARRRRFFEIVCSSIVIRLIGIGDLIKQTFIIYFIFRRLFIVVVRNLRRKGTIAT